MDKQSNEYSPVAISAGRLALAVLALCSLVFLPEITFNEGDTTCSDYPEACELYKKVAEDCETGSAAGINSTWDAGSMSCIGAPFDC